MLAPLVDQPSVEAALLRPLTAAESPYIDALCDQASNLLRARMPTVDTRIVLPATDPRAIDPSAVSAMLAGVIKRYLVNPTGATSMSRTRGPFSETDGFGARPASAGGGAIGEMAVTDADIAKIEYVPPALGGTIYTRPRHVR